MLYIFIVLIYINLNVKSHDNRSHGVTAEVREGKMRRAGGKERAISKYLL